MGINPRRVGAGGRERMKRQVLKVTKVFVQSLTAYLKDIKHATKYSTCPSSMIALLLHILI